MVTHLAFAQRLQLFSGNTELQIQVVELTDARSSPVTLKLLVHVIFAKHRRIDSDSPAQEYFLDSTCNVFK